MRPNFFANTPDILHEYLQHGGPPAFKIRAVLAAMLSPSWGIYSGFELCENVPVRPGSEEYLDSEKYQYRPRDWAAAARDHRASRPSSPGSTRSDKPTRRCTGLRNLRFHHVDQPELICFSKRTGSIPASPVTGSPGQAPGADTVLVVVNVNPFQTREATVWLDLPALGVGSHFTVTDELTGESYTWGRSQLRPPRPGDAACSHLYRHPRCVGPW